MSETIVTGLVTLAVCLINNHYQQKRAAEQFQAQHSETMALLEYKLSELTERVNKHNNLVERTYHLEEEARVHEEKIKVANHRIDDLERREKA